MRRNYLRALGGIAIVASMFAAAGCQDAGDSGDKGDAKCGGKIASFGAFTGANSGLVIPSLNATKLAIKQHNAANPNCKIELVEGDTTGAAAQATPLANKYAADTSILAVIGGAFSGETKATMPIYEKAGLVMVSASATAGELTAANNKAFHRVVGNDFTQAAAAAVYFKTVLNSKKIFVIDDGTTYGAGIAAELSKNLGPLKVNEDKVQEKQVDFAATVSKIKLAAPDAIAFGGYTNEASLLLKQIRSAGITTKFVGFDGIYDPAFPKGAGTAAGEGAIVTCPCLPAEKAGGTFAADYQKEYGVAAGSYGAEGYDAATVLIEGLKAGKTTRKELVDWVDSYDKAGVSKHIKFDATGDVDKSKVVIWAYEVKNGAFVPQQEIKLS